MTDDKKYQYFIYKLYNPDCDYVYVGSTRNMAQRKKNHKSDCNNVNGPSYNIKVYKTIREHNGWNEWFMIVLEIMDNVTKLQAEIREDAYRVELNATMNSQRATRGLITREEYNKQYGKQYYEENKEQMLEQMKQYYKDNKEYFQEYKKQYNIDNKEKIAEKASQKHDCLCGGRYTHHHKATHIKSNKHQTYLNKLNN